MPDDLSFLPPHEPTRVAGFHAYVRQPSVQPGETLEACISYGGTVHASVMRLGASAESGVVLERLPSRRVESFPIHRGSYVHVDRPLEPIKAFSAETWVRPLAIDGEAGLIAQAGFVLKLDAQARPWFGLVGVQTESFSAAEPLSCRSWHHLAATYDGNCLRLFVNGRQQNGPVAFRESCWCAGGTLRLGALGNRRGETANVLTGDLCAPTLYPYPLAPECIAKRHAERLLTPEPGFCAHWKFDALQGEACRDVSPAARHGRPVNMPYRMIPGPRMLFDDDGSTYDPCRDPDFGFAIRCMADQVIDCRWPVAFRWRVPEDLRSGHYALVLQNEHLETRTVPFLVRAGSSRARMACLSSTNTRIAYTFRPFGDERLDYGAYGEHPAYPILGQLHGLRRPASGKRAGYDWHRAQVDFELPFAAWLEREGIETDFYSDWDLEANPDLLGGYDLVAIAGHSEYWTSIQYEALRGFLRRGGHLLVLSGNTGYWRVSIDLKNAVMEARKHGRIPMEGLTCDEMIHAAHWHQLDHRAGTYMSSAGWPEWNLIGSVSNGWTEPPLDGPRVGYRVLCPEHPIFHGPRRVETSGIFAPCAVGYEADLSCRSALKRFGAQAVHYPAKDGSPEPSLESDFDAGLTVLARGIVPDSNVVDYNGHLFKGEMWCELCLWERPGEGSVLNTGSVLSCRALLSDSNFASLILNFIDRALKAR